MPRPYPTRREDGPLERSLIRFKIAATHRGGSTPPPCGAVPGSPMGSVRSHPIWVCSDGVCRRHCQLVACQYGDLAGKGMTASVATVMWQWRGSSFPTKRRIFARFLNGIREQARGGVAVGNAARWDHRLRGALPPGQCRTGESLALVALHWWIMPEIVHSNDPHHPQ